MLPDTLRDVTSSLLLSDAVSGDYSVELIVKDGFTRNILTTSATQFQVQRDSLQSLVGTMSAEPGWVYQGDPTLCEDSLINRSSTGLTGVTITRQLLSVASGLVISEQTNLQDVAAGTSASNLQSIDTENKELGQYLCVLSASIEGKTEKLAAAGFEVREPPIKIDITLQPAGKGRLLVLLGVRTCAPDVGDDTLSLTLSSDADDCEYTTPGTVSPNQVYLETLLNNTGWSYTIVNTPGAFTTEMRTGAYSVYALLGNDIEIESSLEVELREAVYRGDGLLSANAEIEHNDIDYSDDALGDDDQEPGQADGINLSSSLLIDAGSYLFDQRRSIRSMELKGATSGASFEQLSLLSDDPDNNAITHFSYGEGKSVYIGFDILTQAALPGTGVNFETLLLNALDYVHPEGVSHDVGRVVPVTLQLQNKGIPTPGRIVASLDDVAISHGARIVDAYSANGNEMVLVNAGAGGDWLFSLAESANPHLVVWVRLPSTGATTLTMLTQTGTTGAYRDFATDSVQLLLTSLPDIDVIISELDALQYASEDYKDALDYMTLARDAINRADNAMALTYLLETTSKLNTISTTQAGAIRLDVDALIRHVAAQL